MDYTKRTVRCSSVGISREEAHSSLTNSDKFTAGSEVLSLTKRGNKWVAVLLQPKTAEFPPPPKDDDDKPAGPPEFEDADEGAPEDDAPKAEAGDSDSPEGDEKPSDDSGDKPKSEKAEIGELVSLVHQIIDHLGIGADPAVPGAEDGPMPGPDGSPLPPPPGDPAGAPPHGGPGGDPQVVMHKTKLKPGDVAPGQLPIGAPAFSSVQDAPLHRMASFDAFDDDAANKSIKQAKAELEELYGPHGFKVRQIKRVEGGQRIAAKLSRR